MIIFLYGPDSYRRQKKINKIIEEYRKKYSGLSYNFFDLENPEEFNQLKEFSSQGLLFDIKKMAILKNIFEIDVKFLKEFFIKYLTSKDFTILISENNAPPEELNFLIKKAFLAEKFENFKGEKWQFFIQKESKKRNISFSERALSFLANVYQNDSWGLINELEKISLISSIKFIDIKDLKKISDYDYESSNIFDFINAIIKNSSFFQKIISLEKLFINQEEPVKIFNIFASLNYLPKDLIRKLADYDIMVKSGKLDYEGVFLDLALTER